MANTDPAACTADLAARQGRHNRAILLTTLLWTGAFVVVDKAEGWGWWTSEAVTVAAIVAHAALGALVIRAFLRLLADLDDLQRKVQIDALAVGFGAGLFGCFSYHLLVTWGLVTDVEVADIILLMTGAYMAAHVIGMLRYR